MRKQERAARTRQGLIRAAAQAFAQRGYVQARLTDISASAGVSPGALHFHFENKAALAAAVEAEASAALRGVVRDVYHGRQLALQTLTDATHALAELLREDVVARSGFQLGCQRALGTELSLRQEWQGCVQHLLALAASEGTLAEGVAQQDMVTTIVGATIGFEVLGRDNPEWLSRQTITGFWRAMQPRLAAPGVLGRLDPEGRQQTEPSVC
ncbi:ScbR family autoregulator-binding transcription factor [Streptomyces silvisoli]|uniref:ScbR family autoregulator-binding transcription factor n=1 Tax=Streptomyces silvisoli TaxID=3034235 RepID=A0ABT5ZNI5_9ACTN|nr:ScbR family autoregulator-binding transcription factor [Streptomyces silvisoli]MDF3291395.1 ScbR family autoregulator-binding transcription factor [Streptomyces silvisoli]